MITTPNFVEKYKVETQSFRVAIQQVSAHRAVQNTVYYSTAVQSVITATQKIPKNTIIDDKVRRDTYKPFVVIYKSSLSETFITSTAVGPDPR